MFSLIDDVTFCQVQFNDILLGSRGASAVSPTSDSEIDELHQSTKMSIDITSTVNKIC